MFQTLILCAHGATSTKGRSAISGLVNAVRREAQERDVVEAFLDVQLPTLTDVVRETSGPRTVVPLLLGHDHRAEAEIMRAARRDPGVTVSSLLGPDWALAEAGVRRLVEVGARADDSIVLAAAAAPDERGEADLRQAAQFLSAVWGGRIHVGTLPGGGNEPSLADTIDVARAYGGRVVVSSYLLGPGTVHDAFAASGADLTTAPLLDGGPPDPRLVGLIVDRAQARGSWPLTGT